MKRGTIYLFPSLLSAVPVSQVLPQYNIELIRTVKYFVVEELRTARRFLKACDRSIDIDSLHIEELNEHTPAEAVSALLSPVLSGNDIGVISEAGCPAVADPGSDLVAAAQREGIRVVPLVGPNSILLSLMASGFNGQSFTFHGYLPIDSGARASALKQMEGNIRRLHQTQIFIETPYRNMKLVEDLIKNLPGNMRLCIACDITGENEFIRTCTLSQWKQQLPELNKRPTIFLLYS